jgi:hypothetical protein
MKTGGGPAINFPSKDNCFQGLKRGILMQLERIAYNRMVYFPAPDSFSRGSPAYGD